MAKIRQGSAAKWARVTPQRSEDYQKGINNPRTPWAAATKAAAANWGTGVQKAVTDGRFAKGVEKAGDAKWARKANEVGVSRFGPGVQAAQADYETGFAPFAQVIEATVLPPRFAKGDPRNLDRVKVIAEALRKRKVG